jgi:hypothetical protein
MPTPTLVPFTGTWSGICIKRTQYKHETGIPNVRVVGVHVCAKLQLPAANCKKEYQESKSAPAGVLTTVHSPQLRLQFWSNIPPLQSPKAAQVGQRWSLSTHIRSSSSWTQVWRTALNPLLLAPFAQLVSRLSTLLLRVPRETNGILGD